MREQIRQRMESDPKFRAAQAETRAALSPETFDGSLKTLQRLAKF